MIIATKSAMSFTRNRAGDFQINIGKRNNRVVTEKAHVLFPTLREITRRFPGATYISWPTGICAYAFAKAAMKMKSKGVYPTECLEAPLRNEVIAVLRKEGVAILLESDETMISPVSQKLR